MYDVRKECPKTCENPSGKYDCGEKVMTEGCFCKKGYVEGDYNQCILESKCGCAIQGVTKRLEVKKNYIYYYTVSTYSYKNENNPAWLKRKEGIIQVVIVKKYTRVLQMMPKRTQ